jgi:hypothetical protein
MQIAGAVLCHGWLYVSLNMRITRSTLSNIAFPVGHITKQPFSFAFQWQVKEGRRLI